MDFVWMLVIGLLVGVVAKLLMPGNDPGGYLVTTFLGMAGAFLAGLLGRGLGWYGAGGAASFIASVIGAVVLLIVYRLFMGGGRHVHR